ncbi:hypothetical protein CMK11_15470 [Candidatus Poribacteria bacterium]|nr:hypothetical protein [Candidatus Poribacteria bacterium]
MLSWKWALGVALVASLSGTARAAIDPGLVVGAWPLDDGDGVDVADISANGRIGQLQGGDWVDGEFSGAIEFAKGDTVQIPLPAESIQDRLTVMMWVQFTDVPGQQNYFAIWDGGSQRIVPYKTDGHILHLWSNSWNVASGFQVEENTWYHVANVLDGSTVRIYVDGQLQVEQGAPGMSLGGGAQSAWIATDKGNWHTACIVDDVLLLNDAIDAKTVGDAMANGVEYVLGLKAVDPRGKIASSWAALKAGRN